MSRQRSRGKNFEHLVPHTSVSAHTKVSFLTTLLTVKGFYAIVSSQCDPF